MNTAIYIHVFSCLLDWLAPSPHNVARLTELQAIAIDVATTDATEEEGEALVAVCKHESRCHVHAVGDGGHSRGPWQVWGGPPTAQEALRRLRWSTGICGEGGLALYAGARHCGDVPRVVRSLLDPTVARE